MQSLAAGGLAEGGEAQPLQPLPHLLRRRDHLGEGHILGGIEVEDQPVGVLDIPARAPQGWISVTPICASATSPSMLSMAR